MPCGITMMTTTIKAAMMSGQRSGRYTLARYSTPTTAIPGRPDARIVNACGASVVFMICSR